VLLLPSVRLAALLKHSVDRTRKTQRVAGLDMDVLSVSADIAAAIVSGQSLTTEQYHALVQPNAGPLLQAVNAAAPQAAPCLVELPAGAPGGVITTGLAIKHLLDPGLRGVVVLQLGSSQQQNRRRSRGEGGWQLTTNSFSGRVNYLPSERMPSQPPLIGKRYTTITGEADDGGLQVGRKCRRIVQPSQKALRRPRNDRCLLTFLRRRSPFTKYIE
jgi:hypothetical protein